MELLNAREQRVMTQQKLQKEYPCPLICFTMNIAGPVKTSPAIIRAFRYGIVELDKKLNGRDIKNKLIQYEKCGPVAFYSVSADPLVIKDICVGIEEALPIGRLFDMDVLLPSGKKTERKVERACIVCGKQGRVCAAGRLHSVDILQSTTKSIIKEHFITHDCKRIAFVAKNSLIKEVLTTPKPGLVDMNNTGSHTDMNVESFIKSADALLSYFEKCVKTGIETAGLSPDQTFAYLRSAGLAAEKDMYASTGGVNTHKGIIYSLGILLGAIGRLWTVDNPIAQIRDILEQSSLIVGLSGEKDFENISPTTAGARFFLLCGKRGIRGEVADGFPSVRDIALPVYRRILESSEPVFTDDTYRYSNEILSKKENDAGVLTLLHLISEIYDTSIYNRGGEYGINYARDYASHLLSSSPISISAVENMDIDFIKINLSPGGAADLLAITYFINDICSNEIYPAQEEKKQL